MKIVYFYYILGCIVIILILYYIYLDRVFREHIKKEIAEMMMGEEVDISNLDVPPEDTDLESDLESGEDTDG
jgi:hypothetical protein